MRFLVSIMVVSALALLPAMAQAACTNPNPQVLGTYDDSDLPQESDTYAVTFCISSFSWVWEFDRTSKDEGRTRVWVTVDGSDVNTYIDSDDFNEGLDQQTSGSGAISKSPNQIKMKLDATHNDTGHFNNMDFSCTYSP